MPLIHFRGADPFLKTEKSLQRTSTSKPHLIKWLISYKMTLKQACSSEYQGAQDAFKDSMIHWILQFTLLIAFRCVLHRCESQEIRCWKLYILYINNYILNAFKRFVKNDIDPDRYCKEKLAFQRKATAVPTRMWIHKQSRIYKMCTVGENNKDETSVHAPESQQQPVQVYTIMILPQVHLRKPCYDFYFL